MSEPTLSSRSLSILASMAALPSSEPKAAMMSDSLLLLMVDDDGGCAGEETWRRGSGLRLEVKTQAEGWSLVCVQNRARVICP